MNKIVSFDSFISSRPSSDKKIVLVGGCFDIFHYGHLIFLSKAKEKGDLLVILLESDKAIQTKKKQLPIHTQQERAEILAALNFVDYVITIDFLESDEKYFKTVQNIKPAIIAITEGDELTNKKQLQADSIGAKLEVVTPLIKKFSSTNIKNHALIPGN